MIDYSFKPLCFYPKCSLWPNFVSTSLPSDCTIHPLKHFPTMPLSSKELKDCIKAIHFIPHCSVGGRFVASSDKANTSPQSNILT